MQHLKMHLPPVHLPSSLHEDGRHLIPPHHRANRRWRGQPPNQQHRVLDRGNLLAGRRIRGKRHQSTLRLNMERLPPQRHVPNHPPVLRIHHLALWRLYEDSIAFADNQDDKFTALANFFTIYSAAGNVYYPDLERTEDTIVPWEFHTFEILYYTCVNTYETVYEAGVSTTKIMSSSNVPFKGKIAMPSSTWSSNSTFVPSNSTSSSSNLQENLPTYNSGCYFPAGLVASVSGDICPHIEKPGSFTALQSPHHPNDSSQAYITDRYVGATISGELFFKARQTFIGDGIATHRSVSTGVSADAVKEALWGPAQRGNFTGQQREDRLRAFMNGFAVSLSNGLGTVPPPPGPPPPSETDLRMGLNKQGETVQGGQGKEREIGRGVVLGEGDSQTLRGTSWESETFINIHWGWAGFLAAQMGFSYLFLAVTVYRTRRLGVPVLKSSEITTLLAGGEGVRECIGGLGDLESAERRARGARVILDSTGSGKGHVRFVVVDSDVASGKG